MALDPTKHADWEIAEDAETRMKTVYQLADELGLEKEELSKTIRLCIKNKLVCQTSSIKVSLPYHYFKLCLWRLFCVQYEFMFKCRDTEHRVPTLMSDLFMLFINQICNR